MKDLFNENFRTLQKEIRDIRDGSLMFIDGSINIFKGATQPKAINKFNEISFKVQHKNQKKKSKNLYEAKRDPAQPMQS